MSTILDAGLLTQARRRYLRDTEKDIKHYSRRAELPEDRAALAELERELLDIEQRWAQAGLLNGAGKEHAHAA